VCARTCNTGDTAAALFAGSCSYMHSSVTPLLAMCSSVLLQRSTCADKDVFKWGMQQQRCAPGFEYDPTKADVSPPNRKRCCKVRPYIVRTGHMAWVVLGLGALVNSLRSHS
jgi:hypothetical protein